MRTYSLAQGERLVKAARQTMELYLTMPKFDRSIVEKSIADIDDRHGLYVTLAHYPTRELRGSMGSMKAAAPVSAMLIDAAIAATAEDQRFVPVSHREFDHIIVEVSLLSKPEKFAGGLREIKKGAKPGKDGILIEYGYHNALILPSIAQEKKWSVDEYMEQLCVTAGLPTHRWKQSGVSLMKFSTQVFRETSPNGPVEEIMLE